MTLVINHNLPNAIMNFSNSPPPPPVQDHASAGRWLADS